MLKRNDAVAGGIVLCVALVVRVLVWVDVQDAPYWRVPVVDERQHLEDARRILAHEAPPHGAHYTAPGYAYALALIQRAGGNPQTAKIIQLVLGACSAVLLWAVARRTLSAIPAVVVGLLWAFYPVAILYEVLLLKPTLTLFLVLSALAILGRARGHVALAWFAAGGCLGLAGLLRGEMLLASVVIALCAWGVRLRRNVRAPSLLAPASLLLGVAIPISYPTIQNLQRGGGFVVLAYGSGPNFYIGNHAHADGSYLPLREDRSDASVEEADANELAARAERRVFRPAEVSRYWWRKGLEWWRHEPVAAVLLTIKKAMLLWGPWEQADALSTGVAARWLVPLHNRLLRPWLLLPVALLGIWSTRRQAEYWLLRAFLLGLTLAIVPFFVFERFRLPMVAVSLIFAMVAATRAVECVRARRWRLLGAGLAATVVVGALLAIPRVGRFEKVLQVNIGNMLFEAGRYQEALQQFEEVQRGVPEAWRVGINLANAHVALDHPDEALQSLEEVLKKLQEEARRSDHPAADELLYCHELAGDLLYDMADYERAMTHYDAALRYAVPEQKTLLQSKRLRAQAAARR